MITQEQVDLLLSEPPLETIESLREHNAVLLNAIRDYQQLLYQQSHAIAELMGESHPIDKRFIH